MESKIIFRMIKTERYHTYQRIIIIYHNIHTKYKIIIRPYFVLSPFLSLMSPFLSLHILLFQTPIIILVLDEKKQAGIA